MPATLQRPPRPERVASPSRPRPLAVPAALSALSAVAVPLAVVEAVTLVLWLAQPSSGASTTSALRVGSLAWLLGHGVPVSIPGGRLSLPLTGIGLCCALMLARSGASIRQLRWPDRAAPGPECVRAAAVGAALAVPYGLLCAAIAAASRLGSTSAPTPLAFLCGGLLALVAGFLGAARHPVGRLARAAVPGPLRTAAAGAGVSLGVLGTAGALVLAGSLVLHLGRVADVTRSVGGGFGGAFGLTLLALALLPTGVIWSAAVLAGPGVSLGTGASVTLTGGGGGALPPVPIVAALPQGAPPSVAVLLLAVPILGGVLTGRLLLRRAADGPRRELLTLSAASGAVAALGALLAGLLARGAVGPGRLAHVGPSPVLLALAVFAFTALPAAATVTLAGIARKRYPDGLPVGRWCPAWLRHPVSRMAAHLPARRRRVRVLAAGVAGTAAEARGGVVSRLRRGGAQARGAVVRAGRTTRTSAARAARRGGSGARRSLQRCARAAARLLRRGGSPARRRQRPGGPGTSG